MRILIVFDSLFGNTQKIAQKIEQVCKQKYQTKLVSVSQIDINDVLKYDLVFIGSPTQGGRATLPIQRFINQLDTRFAKIKFASFDTRFDTNQVGWFLKILMKVIGYASEKISKSLREKKIQVIGENWFFVSGKQGPLFANELEKVGKWASLVIEKS